MPELLIHVDLVVIPCGKTPCRDHATAEAHERDAQGAAKERFEQFWIEFGKGQPRQSTRQEAHHAHSAGFQVKPVDQRPGHQHGQKRRRRTRPPMLAGQNHRKSCQPDGQCRQMGVW